jgi:DNA-binding transcriptional regulator YbjK
MGNGQAGATGKVPKIVDHDSQRIRFAEAAMRLVAREGFEAMTMRAVAAEAGLSYGSLFHYFESRDDLLMFAIRHSTTQQGRRVNEFAVKYRGLRALEQLMCDDALVDSDSRDDWLVWLAFLYKAALQESFAEMHAELIEGWTARIRRMLEEAAEDGEIPEQAATEFEAKAIWVYSAGIGQQGLLHPSMFPPGVQKQLITAYLDKLR